MEKRSGIVLEKQKYMQLYKVILFILEYEIYYLYQCGSSDHTHLCSTWLSLSISSNLCQGIKKVWITPNVSELRPTGTLRVGMLFSITTLKNWWILSSKTKAVQILRSSNSNPRSIPQKTALLSQERYTTKFTETLYMTYIVYQLYIYVCVYAYISLYEYINLFSI